jgi:hypothetical protein
MNKRHRPAKAMDLEAMANPAEIEFRPFDQAHVAHFDLPSAFGSLSGDANFSFPLSKEK